MNISRRIETLYRDLLADLIGKADAEIIEPAAFHLARLILVAAIEESFASHSGQQLLKIDEPKLLPLGDEGHGIGSLGSLIFARTPCDAWVREDIFGFGQGHGIVEADLRSMIEEFLDELERGRLADVIGVGLECQPPDRDRLIFKDSEVLFHLLGEEFFLPLVDRIDGSEKGRLVADSLGHGSEGMDIFREAGAAISDAGIKELIADPVVGSDPNADVVDVGAEVLAEAGNFIHERDAGRKHGVGSVFGHLGRAVVHDEDAVMVDGERRIKLFHHLGRLGIVNAEDDPVWFHAIGDSGAFFEELGVGDDVKWVRGGKRGAHGVSSADRNGRFDDDEAVAGHMASDLAGGGRHILQVARSIVFRRGGHSDEADGYFRGILRGE